MIYIYLSITIQHITGRDMECIVHTVLYYTVFPSFLLLTSSSYLTLINFFSFIHSLRIIFQFCRHPFGHQCLVSQKCEQIRRKCQRESYTKSEKTFSDFRNLNPKPSSSSFSSAITPFQLFDMSKSRTVQGTRSASHVEVKSKVSIVIRNSFSN